VPPPSFATRFLAYAFDFYGDGSYRAELKRLARELGVVAVKRTAFRELTHCNKMFDFIAMRRPAIVSRTQSVEAYFGRSCFLLFESGDERDLAQAIRTLYRDPALGDRLVRRPPSGASRTAGPGSASCTQKPSRL
jgi:hypothetical protein